MFASCLLVPLTQFHEHTACGGGVDKGDHVPTSTWTGFGIDQSNTVLCEVLQ